MKTKISVLFLSVFLIAVGIYGVNYLTNNGSNVRGTESQVLESSSSQQPENQSVRLFDKEIDYDIDNTLRALAAIADSKVIEIVDANFNWQSQENTWNIDGKGLTVNNVSSDTQDSLLNYFENNGFYKNEINSSVDNVGLRSGFSKDSLACLVRSTRLTNSQNYDFEIRCGELPKEYLSEINDEKTTQIKKLFSEKYNKDPSLIKIDFTQEAGDYLKGSVQFLEEGQTEPNPGDAGIFLAAKDAGGNWELVFDGNGIVTCQEIEAYNFPVSIVPQCYNQELEKLVDRTK